MSFPSCSQSSFPVASSYHLSRSQLFHSFFMSIFLSGMHRGRRGGGFPILSQSILDIRRRRRYYLRVSFSKLSSIAISLPFNHHLFHSDIYNLFGKRLFRSSILCSTRVSTSYTVSLINVQNLPARMTFSFDNTSQASIPLSLHFDLFFYVFHIFASLNSR